MPVRLQIQPVQAELPHARAALDVGSLEHAQDQGLQPRLLGQDDVDESLAFGVVDVGVVAQDFRRGPDGAERRSEASGQKR